VSEEPWLTPFLSIQVLCVCIAGGTIVHIWRYFVPHCHYTMSLLFVSINGQEFVVCLQFVTKCCRQVVMLHHCWSNQRNCNCTWSTTSSMLWVYMNHASHKIFQPFRSPILPETEQSIPPVLYLFCDAHSPHFLSQVCWRGLMVSVVTVTIVWYSLWFVVLSLHVLSISWFLVSIQLV
jgi:hypothetical protein